MGMVTSAHARQVELMDNANELQRLQIEQARRNLQQGGTQPIVGTGFGQVPAVNPYGNNGSMPGVGGGGY